MIILTTEQTIGVIVFGIILISIAVFCYLATRNDKNKNSNNINNISNNSNNYKLAYYNRVLKFPSNLNYNDIFIRDYITNFIKFDITKLVKIQLLDNILLIDINKDIYKLTTHISNIINDLSSLPSQILSEIPLNDDLRLERGSYNYKTLDFMYNLICDNKLIINLNDLLNFNYHNKIYLKYLYYYIVEKLPENIEKPTWFIQLDNYIKTYIKLDNLYKNTIKKINEIHIENKINELIEDYNTTCINIINTYDSFNKQFINTSSIEFTLLKNIRNNLDSLHIKGCYIIRNRENNKVYVGQSKDIATRLTQHFDNECKPLNHIFFEDYYNSKVDNKADLFEIRFEECDSKDDLDRKEKELIEKYNSFNYGYNGTRGNN